MVSLERHRETEADVGASAVLRVAEAVGGATVNGEAIPPAAARHPVFDVASRQPRAAICRRALVIRVVLSGAPLPHVAMNVVQAEIVGSAQASHRDRAFAGDANRG